MEMAAVGGVVVRRQHHVEGAAGAVAHLAQEAAFGAVVLPVLGDADGRAVGKRESGDVDSVRGGVLAAPAFALMVAVAAGVRAEVTNGGELLAITLRRRSEHLTFP